MHSKKSKKKKRRKTGEEEEEEEEIKSEESKWSPEFDHVPDQSGVTIAVTWFGKKNGGGGLRVATQSPLWVLCTNQ